MAVGQRDVLSAVRGVAMWPPVLIAAVTLTVSCATPQQQPSRPPDAALARAEQGVTDQVLANAVYSALDQDPMYFFRHVDVQVDQGVAQLSGYVWSTDAIYRARTIATRVPGVTGVVTNQLELQRGGLNFGPAR